MWGAQQNNGRNVFQETIANLDRIDEFLPSADELDDRSEDILDTSSCLDRLLNDSDDGSTRELAPSGVAPNFAAIEPSPILPSSYPLDTSSASSRPIVVESGSQDSDLISFNAALDASIASFKQSAVRDFDQAKLRLNAMAKAQRDADTCQWQSIVGDKNTLIDLLKSQNSALEKDLATANLHTTNALRIGQQTLRRNQQLDAAKLIFMKWRRATDNTMNERIKTNMAFRLRKERLMHTMLHGWERKVRQAKRAKELEAVSAANQLERQKMISMAQIEKDNMQTEINNLRSSLAKEQEAKNNLQDNLKRVFMRGVSALNFEAMTLLAGEPADEPLPDVDAQIRELTTKMETTPPPAPAIPDMPSTKMLPIVKEDTATTTASKPELEEEAPRKPPMPEAPMSKKAMDTRKPLTNATNKSSLPFVCYSKDSRWQSVEAAKENNGPRVRVIAKTQ